MRLPLASSALICALALLACTSHRDPADDDTDAAPAVDAMEAAPDATPPDARPPEICDNDIEDDGDGWVDCDDSDCVAEPYCQPEMMCGDGVDEDLDGAADCADPDCVGVTPCLPEALCGDGADDDGDGAVDCADADCLAFCLTGCRDGDAMIALTGTALPSALSNTAPVTVNFPVSAQGWITGAAVRFSATHTFDGDLDVILRAPGNASLDLTSDNGGADDNYTGTVLTDRATVAITAGTAPFTGEFRPEQAFSTIAGAAVHGVWRLGFVDDAGGDNGSVEAANLYLCVCDGTAGCERGLACLDGDDNDGDGVVDCADPDCATLAQCVPESNCADHVDNDLDGAIDCIDDDCNGVGTCEHPEHSCGDGVDNDQDLLVDCADTNCFGTTLCLIEPSCDDGSDDDGDGRIDCADPGCLDHAGCAAGPEIACGDGIDNDGNGAIDCADTACAASIACTIACPAGTIRHAYTATDVPQTIADLSTANSTIAVGHTGLVVSTAVQVDVTHAYDEHVDLFLIAPGGPRELSTDNGGTGDNYTHTVFVDSAETAITAGAAPFTGAFRPEEPLAPLAGSPLGGAWTLRATDDTAGVAGTIAGFQLVICACDATTGDCELGAACHNGSDDDGDGLVDCAEPSCATDAACNPETNCNDHADDDSDGLIDCADPDCTAAPACTLEISCNNGLDDDGDGLIDCADPGCDGHDGCVVGPETACGDGIDNDGDGAIDCADSQCGATALCALACPTGAFRHAYRATDLPKAITDNATTSSVITVPDAGVLLATAIQVDLTHTFDGDVDLFLDAPGGTRELSTDNGDGNDNYTGTIFIDSAANPITGGTAPFTGLFRPEQPLSTLAGTALAGTWTLRAADDATTDTGTLTGFQVAVCACDPAAGNCEFGLSCRNGSDDDGDGLIDCADPNCAEDATCIPEAVCADHVDQDLDGLIDCADPDCNGHDGCEYGAELSCGDAADNDADGLVDCADADCSATLGCAAVPELDCHNGVDDDGDGTIDCLDFGCNGVDGCEHGGEVSCDDGFDNDGDGTLDCADADCAPRLICAIPSCPAGTHKVLSSAVGLPQAIPDNAPGAPLVSTIQRSGDGLVGAVAVQVSVAHVDDADVDLYLAAPGGTRELSTDNGGAGDDYNGTIFVDSAATAITAGTAPFTGRFRPEQPLAALSGTPSDGAWSLRAADDAGNGAGTLGGYSLLTCECELASGDCELGAACYDGLDGDGDGLVDCADPSCASNPACSVAEHVCNDGLDDDGDGLIDCADPTCQWLCTAIPSCPAGDRLLSYAAIELPKVIGTTSGIVLDSSVLIPVSGSIVTAAARFDAAHTYDGDLTIGITSPAGTVRDLSSGNGGGSDNYTGTIFVDTAATAITAGTAPFTGLYRPEQPLSALATQNVLGAWAVQVKDTAGGDGGSWNDFQLGVCVAP